MKRNWTAVIALLTLITAPALVRATPLSGAFTQEKIKDAAEDTKDAIVKGTKTTTKKTKEVLSKSGEVMTNGWITTRVNARFVNEDLLKNSDINVDTDDHVVTLKGTVMTRAGRTKAGTIAMRTEGVHRVVNHLTIEPKHTS